MSIERGEVERVVALTVLGLSLAAPGCARPPEPEEQDIGTTQEPDVYVEVTAPHADLDPTCDGAGDFAVHNAGFPTREIGSCESLDDFNFDDAVLACGGEVKYFTYYCSDYPGGRHPQVSWTSYFGCCACNASTCPAPGVCNGNTCVTPHPPATQMVSAGSTAQSTHYSAVYTLGQPTTNQGKSTSPGYRVQGGLIGANGSLP